MRLSPKLIRKAGQLSKLLPSLLYANRTLEAAQRELSWIKNELPPEKWIWAVNQRRVHVPLQYILGTQPFGELDLLVKPGVLIPRWETEEWTEMVLDFIINKFKNPISILDVCTGSGCIPLLLKKRFDNAKVHHDVKGLDISTRALSIALENSEKYQLDVKFNRGDIFELKLSEKFDLITSNPPYIPDNDYNSSQVEKSVRNYEPSEALIGDLEFYLRLCEVVQECGASNFIFELGYDKQAQYVKQLMPDWIVGTWNDSAGNLRCVIGSRGDVKLTDLCHRLL